MSLTRSPAAVPAFYSDESPDREWDAIIIGSGAGGMVCASMLARFGHRVLVLEHHSVPGGFTHIFRRHSWQWDVGLHAVGDMQPDALGGHEDVDWHADDRRTSPPSFFLSFPSLKDPRHDPGPEGLHTGIAVAFAPYDAFVRDGRRVDDYEDLKADIERRFADAVFRHFPALASLVAYREVSTPDTTQHFSRSPLGAIYGLEATPARFRNRYLRPRTPLRGLYLAGCDVSAMGVAGAMSGGALAAAAIEPLKSVQWLRSLGWGRRHADSRRP